MDWKRLIWRARILVLFLVFCASPIAITAITLTPTTTTPSALSTPAAETATTTATTAPSINQQAATLCSSCHGDRGNSTTPAWPKIAGLDSDYALKQLRTFKQNQNGCRDNPLMSAALATLTDEDLVGLAAYYAQQLPSTGMAEPTNLALGARLYRAGDKARQIPACLACHGPQGHGLSSAQTPRISGQHAAYVESQLQAYRSGKRCTDANRMMRMIAAKLTDEEVQALANYIQGLY